MVLNGTRLTKLRLTLKSVFLFSKFACRCLSHAAMPKIALYLRLNSCCTQKMKSALINSGVVKKTNGNFRNLLVI